MKQSRNSFTLVEVMITVVIFTVMLASIYTISLLSQRSWQGYLAAIKPRQETLRAVTWMTNELREAKNLFITEDKDSVQLTFERPGIGQVVYAWNSKGKTAGQLIRTNFTNKFIIAYELTRVKFTSEMENEIILEAAAGIPEEFSLKQKVTLRYKAGLIAK